MDASHDEPVEEAATLSERLAALEATEAERAAADRTDRKLELFEALVLSIAALLAAWTGFQAAKWSGVQTNEYSRAGATRVESNRLTGVAGQQVLGDFIDYNQWLQALETEGVLSETTSDPTDRYQPAPGTLSGFVFERFRPELAAATVAWLATGPGSNSDAPLLPFEMPEYEISVVDRAASLAQEAEDHANEARTSNQRADNYVVMTVLLASVLLFVGIGSKMDSFRARGYLFGAAVTLLLAALVVSALLPKEI